jgi:colicin import membrane protein
MIKVSHSIMTAACLLGLGLVSGVSAADKGATPAQQADWEQRLARATALQKDGAERRAAAEKVLEEQTAACFKKFLVNRCRDNAQSDFKEENKAARRIQNEGKAIERQVKKEQLSARDLQAAAEMPEREAELQAREAETTAARQAAVAEEEATRAAKARKAEEGAQRKAEEAERLRKKQADHDARVAQQVEKTNAKAAAEANKPAQPTPAKP